MIYRIYTDGACSGNGKEDAIGGWAYGVWEGDGERVLWTRAEQLKNTTNNICELTAVIEACKFILMKITPFDTVEIYTDSAYIHNCFKDRWYKKWKINGWINSKKEPVKNQELWEELTYYFELPEFNFYKVKGHANDKRNNLIDMLAVQAKEKREDS